MDDVGQRKQLNMQFDTVVDYVKFGYNAHLNAADDVAHKPEHTVLWTAHDDDRVERHRGSGITQWKQCMYVFQAIDNIRDAMKDQWRKGVKMWGIFLTTADTTWGCSWDINWDVMYS